MTDLLTKNFFSCRKNFFLPQPLQKKTCDKKKLNIAVKETKVAASRKHIFLHQNISMSESKSLLDFATGSWLRLSKVRVRTLFL